MAALAALLVAWLVRWAATGLPGAPTLFDVALLPLSLMIPVAIWASPFPQLTIPKLTGLILGLAAFRALVNGVHRPRHLAWATGTFLLLGLCLTGLGLVAVSLPGKLAGVVPLLERIPRLVQGLPGAEAGINANELGGILTLFVPVALAACGLRLPERPWRQWLVRLAAALLALFMTAVLVLTQSRSAWIGMAAGLATMAWLRWPRVRVLLGAGALALLLVLLYLGPQQAVALVFPASATPDAGTMASTVSLEGRVELWSRALYAIQDFSFTGTGLGTFRQVVHVLYPLFLVAPGTDIAHAHNVFLQVALDLGLPGLIAYLALVGTALWACWRVSRTPGALPAELAGWLAGGLAGSLVAFHVYGLTDTVALGAKPGFAFWLVLALVASLWRLSRPREMSDD